MIVWLTGQPGSGKSTIAQRLRRQWVVDFVIDGDELRALREEGYDERGRHANIARAQDIALYLSNEGYRVGVALVSPYIAQREALKAVATVLEVYLHTTEKRGKEHYFAKHYQPPENDFLALDTGELDVEQCVERIIEAIRDVCGPLSAAP